MYTRQGSRILCRQVGQGTATLRVHRIGAHPVVRHFLERMNVTDILRGSLGGARQGHIDHAMAIEVLLQNYVLSPGPLYRVAEWVAPMEASVFGLSETQKAAVNDDRIARALDALASERGRNVFFRLALRIIKDFKLDTRRIHFDTTTVTFSGKYETSRVEPRITFGYNKDHRPDLKQLVFGLNVTADGGCYVARPIVSGPPARCTGVVRDRRDHGITSSPGLWALWDQGPSGFTIATRLHGPWIHKSTAHAP